MAYKIKNKQGRNVVLEKRFRNYLYRGDYERCKTILNGMNAEVKKAK